MIHWVRFPVYEIKIEREVLKDSCSDKLVY